MVREINEINRSAKNVRKMSAFRWTRKKSQAALLLAQGFTQGEVAVEIGVTDRTIRRWKEQVDFASEVNRLSLMIDIANRAERLRIAMRMVRDIGYETNRDLLDWLKYAQSETDGVKLDLTAVAEALGLVADGRQAGMDSADTE